jgi:hypothetical protein
MSRERNTGLVREFIEKISGSMLEDQYRPAVAALIRGHAGIYALYKGDRLYYVGLATNLMSRVRQHLKDRHAKRWDKFSVYLANDNEHIKPLESLLLRIVNPGGNRVQGRLPGAKDKKRALHVAMRDHDSNRYAALLGGNVARRQVRKKTSQANGSLVLAGLVERRIPLRAEYKGEQYVATLRKDGYIGYAGEKYESPTAAARAIIPRHVNGWMFWRYRHPKKGWVRLSEIRR